MTQELPKNYNHKEAEPRLQSAWEEKKVYAWDKNQSRENTYVIDTPPPTVSGVLHMGHIFSYTQADFVARYQRMKGKTVFYPMGFDDNGLPTERLVEKSKKIRAKDLSREDFIQECLSVSEEARAEFRRLFTSVALSVDWAQEYHTISDHSRRISQLSFLDLVRKERAYRKLQPMLWDPVDQTAIAQAEVVDVEKPSQFNDIVFTCEETGEDLVIGTTRPELLPACVSVFIHPDDPRAESLVGKHAITPLFGVRVPILADDLVKLDKGTGLVMCCTFGDETDIEWWKKHDLPTRMVLNKYGKLDFEGLDVAISAEQKEALERKKPEAARAAILTLLQNAGLLKKQEPITHAVKTAERSGAVLELLPTPQWFVKVLDVKQELKAKSRECEWHPEWMAHRMEQWIDGLSWDWCVSRQRYFGVPFPVWYSKREGEEGKILFAEPDQLPVNPLVDLPKGYTADEVEPDQDVMDTWATSSVSPQISSGAISAELPGDFERHAKLFPADLRPQAHEIIRTWAFYTLVKAHAHENSVPWKNLMISGWCLAEDKSKMSKSKGNVVTPVDLIEDNGADVVRYWASTSRLGADTAFSKDLLKIGKKLVNKLWNATKFAAIHLEKLDGKLPESAVKEVEQGIISAPLDQWILTRLHRTVAKATAAFEEYEYANARAAVEDFFWNDFCDNYLEMVKNRVYDEAGADKKGQMSAVHAIYHCLDGILRLFAPIVPHITDELWQHIFAGKAKGSSIHARGNWPLAADYPVLDAAEKSGIAGVELLNAIRKAKSEKNVSIKFPIEQLVIAPSSLQSLLDPVLKDVQGAGSVGKVLWKSEVSQPTVSSEDGTIQLEVTFAQNTDAA